jgi:hypothetical protein
MAAAEPSHRMVVRASAGWALVGLALVLSGCAQTPAAPRLADPSVDSGPHCAAARCTSDAAQLPGATFTVEVGGSGRQHTINATIRNLGERTFGYLWVPSCGLTPWGESLSGPHGEVAPREPESHCQPCGEAKLGPGAVLSQRFAWDERLWDPALGRMVDAAPGRYVWTVQFFAWDEGQPMCTAESHMASADVSVNVA